MPVTEPGLRLSISVSEHALWRHRPLYSEIVHRARVAGLAGATVLRAAAGYCAGAPGARDRPVLVIVVDTEARIRRFLAGLDELEFGGLATLDEVEIVHYGQARRVR